MALKSEKKKYICKVIQCGDITIKFKYGLSFLVIPQVYLKWLYLRKGCKGYYAGLIKVDCVMDPNSRTRKYCIWKISEFDENNKV